MFCTFMLIAVLNYGYQFVAGRVLSPEEYGTMYSMFSAANIALLIGIIFQTAMAKIIAVTTLSEREQKQTLKKHCIIQGVIALVTFIVLVALGYAFIDAACIGIYVFCVNLSLFWIGVAQGKKRFKIFNILCLVVPISKIAASIALILGWHYDISFLIIAAAGVLAHFIGQHIMKKDAVAVNDTDSVKHIIRTFFAALLPMGTLAAFSFMHNVTAKVIADDVQAGAYCLAALLGTAMVAIPSAVTPVIVPYASEQRSNKLLLVALGASEGIACLGGVLFLILKHPLLTFMFKENGVLAEPYVLPIFLMFIPIVAVYVLIYYLVAIGSKKILNITCGVTFAAVMAVSFLAKEVTAMSYGYCAIYSIAAIILGITAFLPAKKPNHI